MKMAISKQTFFSQKKVQNKKKCNGWLPGVLFNSTAINFLASPFKVKGTRRKVIPLP